MKITTGYYLGDHGEPPAVGYDAMCTTKKEVERFCRIVLKRLNTKHWKGWRWKVSLSAGCFERLDGVRRNAHDFM